MGRRPLTAVNDLQASSTRHVLEQLRDGNLSLDEALKELRWQPVEDLGHTRLDLHRGLRTGFPEAVFCAGKTPEQVREIFARLHELHGSVIGTRATHEQYAAVVARLPVAEFHEAARIIEVRSHSPVGTDEDAPFALVISAGTSDIPVAEEAAVTLAAYGGRVRRLYDCGVAGLHRLLAEREVLDSATVVIVVAGMEGALPSVVGGLIGKPVIAVPTSVGYGASFGGIAALLGMLNSCASGVAVVNIDNGFGAACLAARILRLLPRTGI